MIQLNKKMHEKRGDVIDIENVLFIKANGPYSVFYIKGNKPIKRAYTLKVYSELFISYGWIRINRTYFINPNHIVDGILVEKFISRRYKQKVLKQIEQWKTQQKSN